MKDDIITWLLIYIDDIIMIGNTSSHIDWVNNMLMQKFMMKYLGTVRYFLSVEVDRHWKRLILTQHKYTLDILYKTAMENSKTISTPYILNHKMSAKKGTLFHDPTLYHNIVSMLQYLTFTRPGWVRDPEHCSVTGYCIYIGRNLVSWNSKKQKAMARSSTEAEYHVMIVGTVDELHECIGSSYLFYDNQSTINIVFNPVLHYHTKHIETDQHYVRQKVEVKEIEPLYVRSCDQVANLLKSSVLVS